MIQETNESKSSEAVIAELLREAREKDLWIWSGYGMAYSPDEFEKSDMMEKYTNPRVWKIVPPLLALEMMRDYAAQTQIWFGELRNKILKAGIEVSDDLFFFAER